jgi:hypothetical protein
MRNNNCEAIRRELDELMLDGTCSTSAAEHLMECSDCREFNRTQMKLRRMVGSLGTVEAPADFDFRLRARLANDSTSNVFHYWPIVQRGLAVAAAVIILAFAVVVVKNVLNQREEVLADKPAAPQQSPRQVELPQPPSPTSGPEHTAVHVPASGAEKNRNERSQQAAQKIKRPLTSVEFSKQRAEVISAAEALNSDASTVFPIDASLEPLRLSLDDGRGNARTISVPTIRFGSQRMLPNKNQLAEKNIW